MPALRHWVLVVEDKAPISRLVADFLFESGFAVHAVEAGEDALRYLRSGAEVDVLFSDINLVGRWTAPGWRARRAQRPELPIVYCSGRYSPSVLAPSVPRSVFVTKPCSPDELCRLLERLTASARHCGSALNARRTTRPGVLGRPQ